MLCDPDLAAFSSLGWKVPSFIYADEGANLYVQGMCSRAFLESDVFTQIQTHTCPLFLVFMKWLPEEHVETGRLNHLPAELNLWPYFILS